MRLVCAYEKEENHSHIVSSESSTRLHLRFLPLWEHRGNAKIHLHCASINVVVDFQLDDSFFTFLSSHLNMPELLSLGSLAHRNRGPSAFVCISCRLQSQRSTHSTRRRTISRATGQLSKSNVDRTSKRHSERAVALKTSVKQAQSPRFPPTLVQSYDPRRPTRQSIHSYPEIIRRRRECVRNFHTRSRSGQEHGPTSQLSQSAPFPDFPPPRPNQGSNIRDQLRKWQELHQHTEEDLRPEVTFKNDGVSVSANTTTRLPGEFSGFDSNEDQDNEEQQALASFMHTKPEDLESVDYRFLQIGDLVELEFRFSDRESTLAVFLRNITRDLSQFMTLNGRWVFAKESSIPYRVPDWISPSVVEPVLDYIPVPKDDAERDALMKQAYVDDLSVPRTVSAPLLTRMAEFWAETQDIYRSHSSALDNAHDILAHETDLMYGSLTSAASTLLQTPTTKLTSPALFTVRKAIARAGFAFDIDRKSHRVTGYIQIRSKEQVRMVNNVRDWIRDWQDDLAKTAAFHAADNQAAIRQHKTPATAQYVASFVEKARAVIQKNREDRQPTRSLVVSPSKKRFAITPTQESVQVTRELDFDTRDYEILHFMESYACGNLFAEHPHLAALPPLLMQATGLYDDIFLNYHAGFMFLQELGTVMPYDNRVRFNSHLLLPTGYSRPLQQLASSLMVMKDEPGFFDSMKGLRHDWGDTPVFCIDDATAKEIDDGISVETAGPDSWWVHVHTANPTAHFERGHPISKYARHMGDSLYMPDRIYAMMPHWATVGHFSLANDRPCLTFSMKFNNKGELEENKITSGTVKNVIRLTRQEVEELIGETQSTETNPMMTLTVGGEPPPSKPRETNLADITAHQVESLRTLYNLAQERVKIRRSAGGIFWSNERPDIQVWQSYNRTGLAWHHPYYRGRRSVEGDPVIQLTTREFSDSFEEASTPATLLVQEMMLAAGEVAGRWCVDRQIPGMFRGTGRNPNMRHPDEFLREVLEPAARASSTGQPPVHLMIKYAITMGGGVLRSRPVKHRVLGLDTFCKVTSPLRRYGDMVMHWQIEAALREEARRSKSLKDDDKNADRSFLPFSATQLESIMLGLAPRERMITNAKRGALDTWAMMFMFRAFHYNECELPFSTPANPHKPLMRVYVDTSARQIDGYHMGTNVDLNIAAVLEDPEALGLGRAEGGDIWEAELVNVQVWSRTLSCRPVRLLERSEFVVSEALYRRS